MTAPSNNRDAETIIADWLLGYSGTDDLDGQRPNAQAIIRWLRDEGWDIRRIELDDCGSS
jgi:hypothetical protein